MSELFATGRIVDLILAVTVLEGIVLIAYYRRTGRGVAPVSLITNLLAGACLMLALRGALMRTEWIVIAACLFAALVAHLIDLRRRWRGELRSD